MDSSGLHRIYTCLDFSTQFFPCHCSESFWLLSGKLEFKRDSFVKNKEAQLSGTGCKVSGMLLYVKTNEELVPDNVYQMSGNQISVKTLDLNHEFSEIEKQLKQIVKDHFGIESEI